MSKYGVNYKNRIERKVEMDIIGFVVIVLVFCVCAYVLWNNTPLFKEKHCIQFLAEDVKKAQKTFVAFSMMGLDWFWSKSSEMISRKASKGVKFEIFISQNCPVETSQVIREMARRGVISLFEVPIFPKSDFRLIDSKFVHVGPHMDPKEIETGKKVLRSYPAGARINDLAALEDIAQDCRENAVAVI